MTRNSRSTSRIGWFRYYVDRFNRHMHADSLHMALWYWALMVQDGEAWICYGVGFEDLQASDNYAFGDTREEAIANYGDKMKEPQS